MAEEKGTMKKPMGVKPEVIDISFDEAQARSIRGPVQVQMRLVLRPDEKQAQEWIIKGNSMVQINGKARKLCKEHGRRFPKDVDLWEVLS